MSVVGNFNFRNPDKDAIPIQLERPIGKSDQPYEEHTNSEVDLTQAQVIQRRESRVGELARQLTRQSTHVQGNLFDYVEGSDTDPFSPNFDARKYTKALGQLSQGAGVERKSGISYRNMSVHGFGSDAGQSTIATSDRVRADIQITKKPSETSLSPLSVPPETWSAIESARCRS